ncbi:unnamed protein product [Owenia fusiformis]|uniref:Uncharacterized protein n=1 Tax=Owenia fusiformis TaxID=6347 RepID=A0A8J1TDZ0_OWEFU|nr:unnamed protein product [Owenia fusiformis]
MLPDDHPAISHDVKPYDHRRWAMKSWKKLSQRFIENAISAWGPKLKLSSKNVLIPLAYFINQDHWLYIIAKLCVCRLGNKKVIAFFVKVAFLAHPVVLLFDEIIPKPVQIVIHVIA